MFGHYCISHNNTNNNNLQILLTKERLIENPRPQKYLIYCMAINVDKPIVLSTLSWMKLYEEPVKNQKLNIHMYVIAIFIYLESLDTYVKCSL